ncbi:MAG: hypothetical protein QOE86_2567 [Solirubrobacteraceae bacterium]|jgi:hypothetical protein|nr:hypothetical protein [Solirubrobacteraceae bacterium]
MSRFSTRVMTAAYAVAVVPPAPVDHADPGACL